jgi:hypothetical protein
LIGVQGIRRAIRDFLVATVVREELQNPDMAAFDRAAGGVTMPTYNTPEWLAAMDECQMQLIADARTGHLRGYDEAARRIRSFHFTDGHDSRFWALLYDISDREAEEGRPLLSALVVP